MIEDPYGMTAGVQAMYERWVAEVRKEFPELAVRLPEWSDLTSEQTLDWMAAYAATVEVSHRMARVTVPLLHALAEAEDAA